MRLIDGDKVIEVIKGMQKAYPIEDQRPHARGIRVALFDCRNLIDEQPTAYDVEKVIEELTDNVIDETGIDYEMDISIDEAIDIVRRGGVDNEHR